MKKMLVFLCIVLASASLMAQVRTGTIWGHVTDTEGAALPGVSVTLRSPYMSPVAMVTDVQGIFRFPSLGPSEAYALTAELQGFKKQEKTGIIVVIGQQSRIDLTMEQGKVEEEVTVVAQTPTVDAKKVSVGKNVTQDILQALPTSRDPWAIMQMTPAVLMDRENVGGSESGQQAGFYAKGDASGGSNNVWALDGVVVTDPAAIGASPGYWDFDSFEEMNVVTGGADVTVQTGGVALNMVTRRGGNTISLGGRFYMTDSAFQSNNLTDALRAQGVSAINKINQIRDYGFNLGGPVIKDKAWLWMSYGTQDINSVTLSGDPQKPVLTNYTFKLNLQPVGSNRFETMLLVGNKTFIGRGASASYPGGQDQSGLYHFGSPIIKIQDEQFFGDDLLVSAKFGSMDSSFQLLPHNDPSLTHLVTYDPTQDLWTNNYYYITRRPMYDFDLHSQYYNDKLFGMSHEFKLGVEYSTRRVTTDSSSPGNLTHYVDLNYPDIDPTGSGNPQFTPGMQRFMIYTDWNFDWSVKQLAAFFQVTITAGRFNFLLGLRFDHQTPSVNASTFGTVNNNPVWNMFDPTVKQALSNFMPGVQGPNIKPDYKWDLWSPRLGITWDLFGTGKTVLKLNGAMYGDFMGTGEGWKFIPQGYNGWMYFYWLDQNNNGIVDPNEVFGRDPYTKAPIPLIVNGAVNPTYINDTQFYQWGGFTAYSSANQPSPYTVDKNATSSRTWELMATLDHEIMPDFSLGLSFTYRKYNHFSWDSNYYADGPFGDYRINGQTIIQGPDSSVVAGQVPISIPGVDLGAGGGRDYYLPLPEYTGTPYLIHTLNSNYNQFWGIDLDFNKRLSHNWMLDGSLSYMDQKQHLGNGYTDPTGLWAYQDQVYAPLGGPRGSVVFSHWMVKLEGLYQLPGGFDVSFTFNARAGYLIPHYVGIIDFNWVNPYVQNTTAPLEVFGTTKLPTFYQLNLRLEKMIKISDTGRIYLMADAFNVLNSPIITGRYDQYVGDYYMPILNPDGTVNTPGFFEPYANNFRIQQILNPFIARFGVRFQI
jgi:hypothetical protein